MENTFCTLSVRHSWRRKFVLLSVREFTLTIIWASPAVKHGAPPSEALVALLRLRWQNCVIGWPSAHAYW